MPILHDTRGELGEDAKLHLIAVAFEPHPEDLATMSEGHLPMSHINYVTVLARELPKEVIPTIIEVLDRLGPVAMRIGAFSGVADEEFSKLEVMLAGVTEDDWQGMMAVLRPTNETAAAYLEAHSAVDAPVVLNPNADA